MVMLALLLGLAASTAPVKSGLGSSPSVSLDYRNSWPREAAAIPALSRELRIEAEGSLERARRDAAEDLRSARDDKRPFHQHYFVLAWRTVGQSGTLLSLQSRADIYTGGAHPMSTWRSILWDRRAGKPVHMGDLFTISSSFEALTRPAYCKALDTERLKRREGRKLGGDFDECPKFADLSITPIDKNKDGLFDAIVYVASPYTAGPYVEGSYSITLPLTPRLITAMKPRYRPSFEAQRQ
jgi:hypothetical protein